jgi:23S rRNA pseudouridine1911/1915/1917 synthase
MQQYKVQPEEAGKRLDIFLAENVQGVSRSLLQKLLADGSVSVNDAAEKASYSIRGGDVITVTLPETPDYSDQTLPIIYEDGNVTVINKPSGILTHAKGAPLHEFTVAEFMRTRTTDKPESNRPGIVHRLDRDTSGIIICARTPEAQSFLQKQFSERNVKKNYKAIATGIPAQPEAIIRLPIERDPKNPQKFRIGSQGKPAETHFKLLKTLPNGFAFIDMWPLTGRTHQLRVHMAYLGTPIAGDRFYGSVNSAHRLMLHAASLEITIPGGKRKVFDAPLPEDFNDFMHSELG